MRRPVFKNAAIVLISSGEFMDTLMAHCVWWLFKQDINQRQKEQCAEWKRIWSVNPRKQDEAQALHYELLKLEQRQYKQQTDSLIRFGLVCIYNLI